MISLNIDGKDIDLEDKDNILYKKLLEDCSVKNIIKDLKLKNPIYKNTSTWGHFGNKTFTWENTNSF
jgi:S-adenosylmethionine synthetase